MSVRIEAWGATEHARIPASTGRVWLAIGAVARAEPAAPRPTRFVLALDRSSSMAGEKLARAVRAAHVVVDMLADGDELGLVTFDASVAVVVPVTAVGAQLREELHAKLAAVTSGRGTALTDATERALRLARTDTPGREGLAIVLTDGFPFTGETQPEAIVERVRALSRGAVLSTVGIGDELDAPLLMAMAEVGLGRFLHLAGDDDPAPGLGAELTLARTALTGRAALAVQLRAGLPRHHAGTVSVDERGPGVLFELPPLVADEPVVVPLALDLAAPLPLGRLELGLATLRAPRMEGPDLIVEVPISVEVGERLAESDPRVFRARALLEAAHAMRGIALAEALHPRMKDELVALAGRIIGRAEAVGLAGDAAIGDAVRLLCGTAEAIDSGGDVRTAAPALGLERGYDPHVGSVVEAPLEGLRRPSQRLGEHTAQTILGRDRRP